MKLDQMLFGDASHRRNYCPTIVMWYCLTIVCCTVEEGPTIQWEDGDRTLLPLHMGVVETAWKGSETQKAVL